MDQLLALFRFGLSPLELFVRGSAVYWFLFVLFRFVLRRDAGAIGIADILLLVLIADASQNAMAGSYQTVTDGFVLVATIAGWNWAVDWASYRNAAIRRLVTPAPLVLVRRGAIQWRNLRSEHVTVPELMAHLREQGIDKRTWPCATTCRRCRKACTAEPAADEPPVGSEPTGRARASRARRRSGAGQP